MELPVSARSTHRTHNEDHDKGLGIVLINGEGNFYKCEDTYSEANKDTTNREKCPLGEDQGLLKAPLSKNSAENSPSNGFGKEDSWKGLDSFEFKRNAPPQSVVSRSDFTISRDALINDIINASNVLSNSEVHSALNALSPGPVDHRDGHATQRFYKLEAPLGITPLLLGEQLTRFLSTRAYPGTTIMLPAKVIKLDELCLSNNLSFIGSPGTQLIISKGPITLKSGTAFFQECVLSLDNNESKEYLQGAPRRLFEVWNNTELKLVDCMLKTEAKPEFFTSHKDPTEVCIHVHPQSDGKSAGIVRLTACSLINFFTHIVAGKGTELHAENCGFFKSSNSSIIAINPSVLSVSGSIFEDSSVSAIEVRLVSPCCTRRVCIEGNKVANIRASGISICGEKGASFTEIKDDLMEVEVTKNSLNGCFGDAILLKGINSFTKLSISENTIAESGGNGIALMSLSEKVPDAKAIEVINNKISDSKSNGILVFDSFCKIAGCSCSYNALKGILIKKPRPIGKPWVTIENCIVKENINGGIGLIDAMDTKISLKSCRITRNGEYGLILGNTDINGSSTIASQSAESSNEVSSPGLSKKTLGKRESILLKNGEITDNMRGGILLSTSQHIFIDETCIKNNGYLAIFMENLKGKVEYSTKTLKKKAVLGGVKNRYREINIYTAQKSKAACCGCTIF